MTIDEARERIRDLADAIHALDRVLADLAEQLPESPGRDAMFECLAPYDVATELFAVVETVREEYLGPAAEALERAAAIRKQGLVRRFRTFISTIPRATERVALP